MKKHLNQNGAPVKKFGIRDSLAYAAGDLGCNMSFALKGTMALFWTQFMGLGLWYSALLVVVQVWDAIDSNNLQRIRRVLKSPLQLPILSDDIENTTHLGQDSTSSNNRHTSHIRICFHS